MCSLSACSLSAGQLPHLPHTPPPYLPHTQRCADYVILYYTVLYYCVCARVSVSGGRSRLHLIDLGSCVKELAKPRESATPSQCLSLSALGNVILALVNGSKHIPYKYDFTVVYTSVRNKTHRTFILKQ